MRMCWLVSAFNLGVLMFFIRHFASLMIQLERPYVGVPPGENFAQIVHLCNGCL